MSNSTEELIDGIPKDKIVTTHEQVGTRMLTREEVNKIPINIIVNGFSIKDTILDVLKGYEDNSLLNCFDIDKLASDIQESFAVKLGFKQGIL